MVGDNIKKFRTEKGLTQKDLAEQLFVTAQAVSRWENGEVEPSISTVAKIANIFDVSVDEIVGNATEKKEPEVIIEKKYVPLEPQKPVLAVCEVCNTPIYEPGDIIRKRGKGYNHVSCRDCERKRLNKLRQDTIDKTISRRRMSYWLGGFISISWIVFSILVSIKENNIEIMFSNTFVAIMAFTFLSCILLSNNFIKDMVTEIFTWAFVKMPGIIFSLDLDGIIWLLTVKLGMWVLNVMLMIIFGTLAVVLGAALSLVVYPFAIIKSYKNPAASDFT